MGGGGKSQTTTSSATQVSELNLQDTGGITLAQNKGATDLTYAPVTFSSSSDYGAISAGAGLGASALDANANATRAGFALARDISGNALSTAGDLASGSFGLSSDVSHAAIDLGRTGLATGAQLANAGLDNASAAYQSGLTFGHDALSTVQQLAEEFSAQNSALTNNALSGYQSIAQQNSASESTQIQKVALYALAAAVALVVLPALFRTGRLA